jgi:hypothetical protein
MFLIIFEPSAGIRVCVIITDLRKIIIARIGITALAIIAIVADAVVVIALHDLNVIFNEQRKDAIGMRAEGTQVAETKKRIHFMVWDFVDQCA